MPSIRNRLASAADYTLTTLEPRRLLAGIGIDRFFGNNGVGLVQTSPAITPTTATAVAALPDGGFIVAGSSFPVAAKLDAQGNLDPSYGSGGFIRFTYPPSVWEIMPRKVIPLPDGAVIIAGMTRTSTSGYDLSFHRFLANGAPDLSFGVNGMALATLSSSQSEHFYDAAVLSDGTIVGVGSTYNGNRDRALIVRLKPDGTPDTQTPGGAFQIFELTGGFAGNFNSQFLSVLALEGGDYIIGGNGVSGLPYRMVTQLRRYHADGTPVTAFGNAGIASSDTGVSSNLFIAPGGQLMAQVQLQLARYDLQTGQLDTSYGVKTLIADPPRADFIETVAATLTHQGNLAIVYKSSMGLTASVHSLETLAPITSSKAATVLPVYTASSDRSIDVALLAGDQLVAVSEFAQGAASNRPLGFVRFNVFENQPPLLDDGTDSYHLRLNDQASNVAVSVQGGDLVASIDAVEHRVPLAAHRKLFISDAGGTDTVTIGDCAGLEIAFDADFGDDVIRLDANTRAASLCILGFEGNDLLEMRLAPSGAAIDITTLSFDGENGDDAARFIGSSGDDAIRLLSPSDPASSLHASLPNVERISIEVGDGNDHIRLGHVPQRVALVVNAGDGGDTIEGAILPNGFPNNPESTLLGEAGEDRFVFRPYEWRYLADGGDEADSVEFSFPDNSDTLTVLGDDQQFYFTYGSGVGQIRTAARETLVYTTGDGTDRLVIDDGLRTTGSTYLVNGSDVLRDGSRILTASGVDELRLMAGSGDDRIDARSVLGSLLTTLVAGSGNDTLRVDESADTANRLYGIGTNLVRDGQTLVLGGIEIVTVLAGSGEDTFEVVPGTAILWTLVGGEPTATPGDRLQIRIAAIPSPTNAEDSPGNGRLTFGNRLPVEYRSIETVALIPPAILSASYPRGQTIVTLTLETPLQAYSGLPVGQIVEVTNLTTGQTLPSAQISLSGSGTSLRVNLRSSSTYPSLADGNYRLTVRAVALKDSAGNSFGPDFVYDFFILRGDANGDRKVDFDDLLIVAQNYGRQYNPGSFAYTRGDFSGNGIVDFADLLILAQRWGTLLEPAAPAWTVTPSGHNRRVVSELL